MRYNTRSRLYKRLEKKSRKNLIFNLIGIVVITALVLKFGIPMLINFTLFVSGQTSSKAGTIQGNNVSFVAAPVLNPLPIATNSAEIIVTGEALDNQTVSLYVNNILIDHTKTEDSGGFSFNVFLTEEENTIKAKTVVEPSTSINQAQESDFSKALHISYKNSPPTLNIDYPADGQIFSSEQKSVTIQGQTDPLIKVTVNGYWAITDQSNTFYYNLPLQNGENVIEIKAQDQAGNKTEKTIKVTYNP